MIGVPKRISVAVTPDTVGAIERVMEREGVGMAEALRRLVGYGDFVHRAIRDDRAQVIVRRSGKDNEVVLQP